MINSSIYKQFYIKLILATTLLVCVISLIFYGYTRSKLYEEIYNYISDKQQNNDLPFHGDYLGDNELAKNIYEKKYFLKDLDNKLIEKNPEDVFKRLAAFLALLRELNLSKKNGLKNFILNYLKVDSYLVGEY